MTAKVFRAAREHLVRFGWQQGKQGTAGEPCCLIGAMASSATNGDEYQRACDAIASRLAIATGKKWISDWNDAPGRTFAEVLALLDQAIAAEEARP